MKLDSSPLIDQNNLRKTHFIPLAWQSSPALNRKISDY